MTIHLDWKIANDRLEAVCIINRRTYKAYVTPTVNLEQRPTEEWPLPDINAKYTILKDGETIDENKNALRQLDNPYHITRYREAAGIVMAMRLAEDTISRDAAEQKDKDRHEAAWLEKTRKTMQDAITLYRDQA